MAKKLSDILKNIFKNSSLDELNKSNKDKAYDIRKIFEQMELDLISSMKRAFYYHEREQRKEGFQWEQWQRAKLRGMEKYRKENREIIGSYSAPIEKAIRNELNNKYNNGQSRVENLIDRIRRFFNPEAALNLPDDISEKQATREYIAKILNRPVEPPPEENFFSVNDKKLNALQETVKNDIKNANVSVLRKMDDVYRQTIFKVEMYMSAGTKSLNQAVDMATKDFLDKGINSIIYKDGKRVNIASYAEMALRTASHRATLLGEGKKRDEWGLHLVVVSAHANTCKHCVPWQGKVLIDDVFSHGTKEDGPYPLLSEAIRTGLLHPNCRHTLTTYFPGITKIPTVPDNKESIETYEAEQHQRYIERQLRKWKRFEAGSVDAENANKASDKVKECEDRLKQHLDKNRQLRRDYNREKADVRSIKEINYSKDVKQFERYKEIIGDDSPKTLEDFQKLKYNNTKEFNLMDDYYKSRTKGNISAFSTFSDYKKVIYELNSKVVGIITKDGIKVSGYSKHMIDRILGASNDPKTGLPRSGTSINGVLDALYNPIEISEIRARKLDGVAEMSKKYIGELSTVSINPVTGNLIQCNPSDSDKVRRLKEKNGKGN